MERRSLGEVLAALGVVSLIAAAALAAPEPQVLFDLKADKRIEDIRLVGPNEEYVLITNEENVWVYDSSTGKERWTDKVPGHTGMKLVWNNRYYIASMKKGMRCYEVASGKLVWEADMPYDMKKYSQYFSFDSGFVLNFGDILVGFDPNTGKVKWTSDKLDWNDDYIKDGVPVIYEYDRPFGTRFVVLGNKVTQVVDAATGQVLGTSQVKYNSKNTEPVTNIGDYAVFLFGKKMTTAMDLRTGRELWSADEEIDARRGLITVAQGGTNYAVFVSRKSLALFNLDKGEKLWETDEETALRVESLHVYDDGTLVCVGIKNYHTPGNQFGNRGGYTMAMALDFATGQLKYRELLAYSTEPTLEFTIPLIGFTIQIRQTIAKVDWDRGDGALVYVWGQEGKRIGQYGDKWKDDGGEGLVLFDPRTGKVKWRTDLVVGKTYLDVLRQARDLPKSESQDGPGSYDDAGQDPGYVVDGGYAYLNANNTIVKVDLGTGQTVWQGPEIGFASHFQVDNGRVFGEIGYSRWEWRGKGGKNEAEDVIHQSKNNGYFVLDAATGKEVWMVQKLKAPIDLFLHEYLPGAGIVLVCDGLVLQAIDLKKGGYAWEMDLKKGPTGEITASEGVAYILTAVERSTSYGLYTRTTTTTKTYDIQWAHGVYGLADGALLVMAKKGLAVVGIDGKV
ncbi:MAG: PQQ-binding-like beta-propeller repeat protein, partial [bacterium]